MAYNTGFNYVGLQSPVRNLTFHLADLNKVLVECEITNVVIR